MAKSSSPQIKVNKIESAADYAPETYERVATVLCYMYYKNILSLL